jgi:hypothetical protein
MRLCSLVVFTNFSEEHIASIFMISVPLGLSPVDSRGKNINQNAVSNILGKVLQLLSLISANNWLLEQVIRQYNVRNIRTLCYLLKCLPLLRSPTVFSLSGDMGHFTSHICLLADNFTETMLFNITQGDSAKPDNVAYAFLEL